MKKEEYNGLVKDIGLLLEEGRRKALQSVNSIIVQTYWLIGKRIVDFEQGGKQRAKYGQVLLRRISADLCPAYGRGVSRSNLQYMRIFYLRYPICQTLSGKLSWSHYIELVSIQNNEERAFYEKECIQESWGTRDLRRQIASRLFYRLPAAKKEGGFLKLASEGHNVSKAEDIIKNPYVLEFLKLPSSYSEKQLENKIINNLQMFLLELGKGFSFVARQFRMQIGRKQFYADLVFYNKILRCYVLIDLKIKGGYSGAGQMNLYLNYFRSHVNSSGDNEPIGIIMFRENENIEVRYAFGGISSRIFTSKYMLSLPSAEDLRKAVEGVV
ncbi:MAG: PDDEXK nuclease domain-containing protein [Candidatus Nanoarchaeia archaeon]|nr:PDDEXK nuclease domain-containing protein [Candidatus Nanoarchaeia archaeon]